MWCWDCSTVLLSPSVRDTCWWGRERGEGKEERGEGEERGERRDEKGEGEETGEGRSRGGRYDDADEIRTQAYSFSQENDSNDRYFLGVGGG